MLSCIIKHKLWLNCTVKINEVLIKNSQSEKILGIDIDSDL